jgi:hypothetical protein
MRPVTERANHDLAAWHERNLGIAPTRDDVIPAPADTTAWGAARQAVVHLDRVFTVWTLLAAATHCPDVDAKHGPLILFDLTMWELDATAGRGGNDWHLAITAGHSVDLAEPDTLRARVARVTRERQRQVQLRERDLSDGFRRDRVTGEPTGARI